MMSIEAIRSESERAARKAARAHREPYVVFDEADLERLGTAGKKLPFIGTYVPKGWKRVDELFVDSSGFGSPGEPALTQDAFKARVRAQLAEETTYGYAVTEAGQFQCYVGVFVRDGQSEMKPVEDSTDVWPKAEGQ